MHQCHADSRERTLSLLMVMMTKKDIDEGDTDDDHNDDDDDFLIDPFLRTSGRCNRQSEFTLLHFTIFH